MLAKPLTIPAGQPLPFKLVETHTLLMYDVPLPVDVLYGFSANHTDGGRLDCPDRGDAADKHQ